MVVVEAEMALVVDRVRIKEEEADALGVRGGW